MDRLKVTSYSGYRGEQEPRALSLEGECLEVAEILRRWTSPDGRYFEVRTSDGRVILLRSDADQGWSLA